MAKQEPALPSSWAPIKVLGTRNAWQSISDRFDPWLVLISATVALFSLIIVSPLAIVVWLSFLDGGILDPAARYSLRNYKEIFGDSFTYAVLWNTTGFSLVSLGVAFLFGLPAAWLVERSDLPGKTLVFILMTIGLLIPGFAVAMGWLFLLHPRIGVVNSLLVSWLGLESAPLSITTIVGMGWVQGLNLAPVAFIMTAAVFRAMDPALEEAAETSGASRFDIVRTVTLPLVWPGILGAGTYIFTIGFSAFDVPAIIGWSNRIFTFSTYLYLIVSPQDGLPRYGPGATLSAIGILLAGLLSWWYSRLQKRSHRYAVITGKGYRPRLIKLGRTVTVAWLFIGAYLVLSKVLPVLMLVWASLLPYFELPSWESISRITLRNYISLPWDLILRGAWNTALLMVLTPVLTVVLSVAFSWVLLRSTVPGRSVFDFVAFLPHAVPNLIFAIGALLGALFVVQRVVPLYGTVWLLLLLYVIVRLSYTTRVMNSALIQVHKELEEAGYVSGGGTWNVLRRILVPILTPAILYSCLWVALLTYRELTVAVLLSTPNNTTLPVVVWSIWLNGGFPAAAALAVYMLFVLVPLVAIYWVVARRAGILSQEN